MNIIKDGLTFDDVLLVPQHSEIGSRSKIDVSVNLREFKFSNPIIPANMKTVCDVKMAEFIAFNGGLAILHRFMPIEEQYEACYHLSNLFGLPYKKNGNAFGVSVGVKNEDKEAVLKFLNLGVKIVCIDIAHGDSTQCIEMIKYIKRNAPSMLIIAGNVATGEAATRLWNAGANVVKVGVGPGSLCTTRVETGNGVPQLTALMDVAEARSNMMRDDKNRGYNYQIIADGGIKSAGDIVKALCFADMVMAGNLFAGCDEAPGNILNVNGRTYKEYVGSSTHKTNHIEGVAAMVPYKGPVSGVLTKLIEGLQSGCSYQGCSRLAELRDNPQFIKISNSGLVESHPHDVTRI